MTPPRAGIAFSRGLTPTETVECVRLAESLGYESAWVAEGHAGDQFAILAACATATQRIRLGTAISSVFVRSLPTIAMAAATVDELSGGRFILGLGTSHREQVEPEHGVAFDRPTARLRDTVAVVRALLAGGAVSHRGETVAIEHFDLWFSPRRPRLPIYVAALFPKMMEITGEIADGVLLTWPTLEAPRPAAAPRVPDELIDAVAIAGTAAQCRERLDGYRQAGLRLPIVSPRVIGPDARRAAMDVIRACAPVA